MSDKKSTKKSFLERMDVFLSELIEGKEKPKGVKLEGELAEGIQKETGVKVVAESFEAGKELFLVTEEGDPVLAAEGTYELEDGTVIKVDEAGIILEVVVAEEMKDDKKKGDEKEELSDEEKAPISRKEFTEVTEKLFEAISKMSSKKQEMSDQEKADQKSKEDAEAAKLEALKMKLSEKKKKLGDKKTDDKEDVLAEKLSEKARPFVNSGMERVEKAFDNFDW